MHRILFGIPALLCLWLCLIANAQDSGPRAQAEAQLKLAIARLQKGEDLTTVGAGFRRAAELDPTYALPKFYLGVIAQKQETFEEAISHFEAYCKLDLTSDYFVQAQLKLDECKKALEDMKTPEGKARRAAAIAAAKAKEQADGLLAAAAQAEADGLRGKAARLYGEAYRLNPTRPDIGLKAARALLAVDDPMEAVKVVRVVMRQTREGVGSENRQIAKEASDLFKQLEEGTIAEHNRLVIVARRAAVNVNKKPDEALVEALEAMKHARELVPDLQADDVLIAALHVKAGKLDDALAELKRAGSRGPIDAFVLGNELQEIAGSAARSGLASKDLREYLLDLLGKKSFEKLLTTATLDITNSIGMRLVPIRAGTFNMGSPNTEAGRNNDEAQHRVTLSKGFYMGATEVTQKQWEAVMGNNPSYFKGDDLPVEQVSWDDAVSFCKKLSQKEGKTYRLPTEAEWEYACRAGSTTAYHEGDREDDLAVAGWYGDDKGNSDKKTHAVGQKKANAWGLYDMHGNVYEWCSDWFGDYPAGAATDPTGAAYSKDHVLRGGDWICKPSWCRSANRNAATLIYFNNDTGFRVVLDRFK